MSTGVSENLVVERAEREGLPTVGCAVMELLGVLQGRPTMFVDDKGNEVCIRLHTVEEAMAAHRAAIEAAEARGEPTPGVCTDRRVFENMVRPLVIP